MNQRTKWIVVVVLFIVKTTVFCQTKPACDNRKEKWIQQPTLMKGYPHTVSKEIDTLPGYAMLRTVDKEPEFNIQSLFRKIRYPEEMKRKGQEGILTFLVFIDEDGNCLDVYVRCAIDRFGSPSDMDVVSQMVNAAQPKIKKAIWIPAQIDGANVPCWAFLSIPFFLR